MSYYTKRKQPIRVAFLFARRTGFEASLPPTAVGGRREWVSAEGKPQCGFPRSGGAKAGGFQAKLVWRGKRHATRVGLSSPTPATNKNRTFVYRQMFCFCLSKPQAWYIITARSAVHIIKGGKPPLYLISPCGAVSHHAPACIFLRLDDIQGFALMIYRNKLRMIYTPSA